MNNLTLITNNIDDSDDNLGYCSEEEIDDDI